MQKEAYINFRSQIHKKSIDALMRVFGDLVSKNADHIHLIVSSSGGHVQPVLDFYDFAKKLPVTITTHAVGQVASSAIIIFCIAEKRYTHSRGKFLIHGIRGSMQNYSIRDVEEKIIPNLKEQSGKIAEIISEATSKEISDVEREMAGERILDAKQAQEYGLVTEEIDDDPIKKKGVPIITIGDDLFK